MTTYIKAARARDSFGTGEHWTRDEVHPTMNVFDNGDTRTCVAVVCYENHAQDSRVRKMTDGVCVTIGASNANSAGVSGNNPLIMVTRR